MFKNQLKNAAAAVAALALTAGTAVHAALPAGAETAIEQYETDSVQAFGLLITAGIAIFAVRKLGQKMGWL